MAESMVRGWGCMGKVEGSLSLSVSLRSTVSGRSCKGRPLQLADGRRSCALKKELRSELLGQNLRLQSGVGGVRGGRAAGKWRNRCRSSCGSSGSGSSKRTRKASAVSGGEIEGQLLTKSKSPQKEAEAEVGTPGATSLTEYKDSFLEVTAINFLTNRIASASGKATELRGYDGFVDITKKLVRALPSKQQRDTIRDLLLVILPGWLLASFRMVPKTKFVTEVFARVTSVFFRWLVGDSEIREGEVNGVTMKNTVHVKKCRYLEQSQCVGSCLNLCKSPTQEFISKQLGMPMTMIPNFEDMSCDMVYGMHPPPLEEDEAYQQPCFAICKNAKKKVTRT